ncbi:FAD-dependent oxidoreductase [Umezawaea tangerina]|uniref:NADPH-dependent 2,4-dienoyl-CoA reductase/sulfur reductase-like enzyme n=1 Tax=Umezawaea tangerina TaxID=84725 RepID=A0A2T0SV84_9PSEU|nr:FAD-dependent oxidoreductase [Umezawaea tangerina]PRY37325.1 NADPH-dependent 2,4-dienoyl-CoA reductase/sulfur reductase-like enzyme [Umezawaea tangerina]
MKAEERVVIVGGGLAGLRAGERLRELGFNGELMILSAEKHKPYHRPALSKEVITGELNPRELGFKISDEMGATWRLGVPAESLDTSRRMVGLPGGEEVRYDGLIIATGVESRHMPGAPRQDERVHVLRTVDDAIAIRNSIATTQGLVVVIGGGLIGCEIAASVRGMGRDVAIINRSNTLLGGATGKVIGDYVTDTHRAKGTRLALGVKILHWMRQANGIAIHLSDGQVLFAAVVVLAVGSVPSVSWLRGSGLVLEDGLMCEPSCHVVGGTDIVAAGDVARWPNLRFGGVQRRVEHWLNAVEMGRAAAENLLVGRDSSRPYTPVPRFWTEQYGMRIQGAGLASLATDTTTLSQPTGDHRTITGFIKDGKLVAMVALDSPGALIRLSPQLFQQNGITRPERTQFVPQPQVAQEQQVPIAPPVQQPVAEPPTRYAPQQSEPQYQAPPAAQFEPEIDVDPAQERELEAAMAEAFLPRRSQGPTIRSRSGGQPRLLVRSGGGGGRSSARPPR